MARRRLLDTDDEGMTREEQFAGSPGGIGREAQATIPVDLTPQGPDDGGIRGRETPREMEPSISPFPGIASPGPGPMSAAAGMGPARARLSTSARTTPEADISPPMPAAGGVAGITPLESPGGMGGPQLQRRMAQTFGMRSRSPMLGRQEGLTGGGLGVPGIGPGETPDPRLVLKLIQSLMQGEV